MNDQARKRDPDKRGLNIIINPARRRAGSDLLLWAGSIRPRARHCPRLRPSERVNLNDVIIRVHLRDVRLAEVIDAVSKVAETPIKYSVEDYAVVFTQRGNEPQQLFTRTYRVDPNTFVEGLQSVELPRPWASATSKAVGRWRWRWWWRRRRSAAGAVAAALALAFRASTSPALAAAAVQAAALAAAAVAVVAAVVLAAAAAAAGGGGRHWYRWDHLHQPAVRRH